MPGWSWLTVALFIFTAIWEIRAESPGFHLNRVVFINAATDGFGAYHLRSNNLFDKGDNLSLYLEPVNCSVKKVSNGFKTQLFTTAVLKSVTNPVLSQELQIGTLEFVFSDKNTGLYADINLMDVGKLPVDLYELKMTLLDEESRQSVDFTHKFRVGPSYIEAVISDSDSVSYSPDLKLTSEFSAGCPRLYCLFRTRRIPKNSTLKSILYAENVSDLAPDFVLENFCTQVEKYQSGSFFIEFPEETWGVGNYRLELYINEEFEITLYFRIKSEP